MVKLPDGEKIVCAMHTRRAVKISFAIYKEYLIETGD